MAHIIKTAKYWVCGCDPTTGDHIIDAQYSVCLCCGKHNFDLMEIVVPSGLGDVFTVQILEVLEGQVRVKVVNNLNSFNSLPTLGVEFARIAPRWKQKEGPAVGNAEKKNLSMLYIFAAKKLGYEGGNPARSADRRKENKAGYHTWTEAEIQRFLARHGAGSKARLALLLVLNTGLAQQDLCGAGPHMLSLRNGQLRIAYARGKTGVGVDLPVFPELAIEIDALAAGQRIFLTKSGSQEPYKLTSFGNWFKDRCAEADVPGSIHGLSKAGATHLAEVGATENEIASYLVHTDTSQASVYTARRNRSKLADGGLDKLGRLTNFPQKSDRY